MATTFGWYNPYAPVQIQRGLTTGLIGGQEPLKGIIVPVTGGPALVTEPGLNNGFIEVKNNPKVHADPAPVASSTTTTVVTNGGTNSPANGDTTTSEDNSKLTSNEKSQFRKLGVALVILSSFTLGVAVSYFTVGIQSGVTTCLSYTSASVSSLEKFYYWSVRAAALPLPIFTFVIGILCSIIKDRRGDKTQSIYGMAIFSLVLLMPIIVAGSIGGILQALNCTNPNDIGIVCLILPAVLLLLALVLSGILLGLLAMLVMAKKVLPAAKPNSMTAITTTTTTTPAATTPATTIPAPPNQISSPVPAQSLVPQQYALQMPTQLNYAQPNYQPAYPSPYQIFPPRYPPRPPPMFGASPYMRPPTRSPYGYNPYSRPPRLYRPSPYY